MHVFTQVLKQSGFSFRWMVWCSGTGKRLKSICSLTYSVNEEQLNKQPYSQTERGGGGHGEWGANRKPRLDIYFPRVVCCVLPLLFHHKEEAGEEPRSTHDQLPEPDWIKARSGYNSARLNDWGVASVGSEWRNERLRGTFHCAVLVWQTCCPPRVTHQQHRSWSCMEEAYMYMRIYKI